MKIYPQLLKSNGNTENIFFKYVSDKEIDNIINNFEDTIEIDISDLKSLLKEMIDKKMTDRIDFI